MNTEKTRQNQAQMSWWRRLCFGMGLGGGGIIATMGTFILAYYTNVIHIDPGLAGTVLAVSKVLDGVSDLIAGRIVDKTHSRFGKARPWLLRICLPMVICFIAAFSVPTGFSTVAQIAYVFVTYNLFSTVCYTMVSVSYNSMSSLITTSQYERSVNGVLGMTLYTVAMLIINTQMLKMCTAFGGGDVYSPRGWSISAVVLALAYAACVMVTFLFCKETESGASEARAAAVEKPASVIRTLKALITNKYWVEYVIALVTNGIGNTFVMGAALFYAQFVLGDVDSYSSLSGALYIAMFIGVIATFIFIKKLGKRNTAIIGLVVLAAGTILAGILPKTVSNTTITMIIRGFGCGFPSALGTAVLQDTLTYGKWRSGFDMVGMGNAACSFTSKVGGGLGTAALGWILKLGGYDSTAAVQSDSAVRIITLSFTWIPLVFVIITLICFVLYQLDKEYDRYAKDLSEGRYGPNAMVPNTSKEQE